MNGLSTSPRENYLDNLRWIAMLLGVLVHASTLGSFGLIDGVTTVSSMFRMALFFMISGYLGAMLLDRKKVREFLLGRMRNLAVPLVAGTILLNPITIWLMFQYLDGSPTWTRVLLVFAGEDPGLGVHIVWHMHLWFLLSLMCFVLIAALVGKLIRKLGRLAERNLPPEGMWMKFVPTLLLVGGVFLSLALVTLVKFAEKFIGEFPWLVRITLQYTPFYLTGMLLFYAPIIFERIRKTDYFLGAAVFFAYFYARQWDITAGGGGVLQIATLIAMRFWVSFFLLEFGFRFLNTANKFTSLMSRSIYTIYIFHFLFIYILAAILAPFLIMNFIAYWIIVFLTIFFSLIIHIAFIERSAFLLFIFNGRKRSRKVIGVKA